MTTPPRRGLLAWIICVLHITVGAVGATAATPVHSPACVPGTAAPTVSIDLPGGFTHLPGEALRVSVSVFNGTASPLNISDADVRIDRRRTTTRSALDAPAQGVDVDLGQARVGRTLAPGERSDALLTLSPQELDSLWLPSAWGPYRLSVSVDMAGTLVQAHTWIVAVTPQTAAAEPTPLALVIPDVSTPTTHLIPPPVPSDETSLIANRPASPWPAQPLTFIADSEGSAAAPTGADVYQTATYAPDPSRLADLAPRGALAELLTSSAPSASRTAVVSWAVPDAAGWTELAEAGADAVVVPGRSVAPVTPAANQPAAAGTLTIGETDLTIFTTNDELTSDMTMGLTDRHGVCDAQRPYTVATTSMVSAQLAARLAIITLEAPSQARGQVLLLGPRWREHAQRHQRVAADVLAAPWIAPRTLTTIGAEADQELRVEPPPGPAEPISLAPARSVLSEYETASSVVNSSELPDDSALVAQLSSSLWHADASGFASFVNERAEDVAALREGVTINVTDRVTMVATRVELPVVVTNTLPYPVTVDVALQSDTPRLQTPAATRVNVEPTSSRQVPVQISALSNGNADVAATLTNAQGVPITDNALVQVRIRREWEQGAFGVVVAILSLLVGVGVVRAISHNRRRKA